MRTVTFSILTLTLPVFAQQAPSPTFEVATIKSSPTIVMEDLLSRNIRPGFTVDRAQFTARAVSMSSLLLRAYGLQTYQLTTPDWTRTQPYFDILAKIPDGVTQQQVPEMLQALLKERFKLAVHRESQDLPVYTLIVGKNGHKLKEVAPGTPSLYRMSGDPRGVSHIQTVSDMNMLAFTMAPYMDRPVLDRTGLKGLYDVEMDVTRDTEPGTTPLPLLDFKGAVEQLGLKLDARKEPVEMLIVDHLEKTPTDN